jgi:glycosyltransferase involved in cell wall biosynthesis
MAGSFTSLGSDAPRVLVVSFEQFGVHTDTFKYCEHLRDRFRITYLCLDQGVPRKNLDGVEVLYCNRRPLGKVELGLFLETDRLLTTRSFDLVFLRRTKYWFLLRVLRPGRRMVFDIRTGSVDSRPVRRAIENGLIRFNARFFRHVTVISDGLASALGLAGSAHVLPLGADRAPVLTRRRSGGLRLIYIGTFKNRRIECVVEGFGEYLEEAGGSGSHLTVIGFGSTTEIGRIQKVIEAKGLEEHVTLRQRIDHEEIVGVLAEHDVGLAFTPRDPWFEHQPSTKVFEYLASGLLCIATDNAANREVIGPEDGILVEDSARGVCRGLQWAAAQLPRRDPSLVADSVREYSWAKIVKENLSPYLEKVMG